MKKILFPLCCSLTVLALSATAQTEFDGWASSDIFKADNWTKGLPNAENPGKITLYGSGRINQGSEWMIGANVVVEGGVTLDLEHDIGARGGVLTINDATINAGDDIFSGNNGTIIFNAGSASSSGDDFQAQAGKTLGSRTSSSITINGGKHIAGDEFGSQAKGHNFLVMTGGQITAGRFAFDGDGNSIGGSALLLSGSDETTLSMYGSTDIREDWTGSWTVQSFSGADWRGELLKAGWTFGGVPIDGSVFDSNFEIKNEGKTLSLKP